MSPDARAALPLLKRELAALDRDNLRCSQLSHLAVAEIPLSDIIMGASSICDAPIPQLFAWHRDLAHFLVNAVGAAEREVLESACTTLGTLVGEVPRDTVYMYAARANLTNPRTFSGTLDEVTFVRALQKACQILTSANLRALDFLLGEINGSQLAKELADYVNELTGMLVVVIREVDIDVFVLQIEPNFRRIELNGKNYYGPTASQLPLVALESILYGANAGSNLKRHIAFQRDYLPPALRAIIDGFSSRPGILFDGLSPTEGARITNAIQRFRKIHMALARRAFAKQKLPSLHAKALLEGLLADGDSNVPKIGA